MIILNKKQTILWHNFSQKYLQKDIWIFFPSALHDDNH